MSQVIELSSKLLIGRFYGRFLLESKLLERIERVWTHVIGYKSGSHWLVRGWMAFHFCTTDDARKILGIQWKGEDHISFSPYYRAVCRSN